MLKFYTYKNCSTCRKARLFLENRKIHFKEFPIRETPPSSSELQTMLLARGGKLTKIFNSGSQDYRDLSLKEKLPTLGQEEAFQILHRNGNLVKRPFLIGGGISLVGFREEDWEVALNAK